MGADDGAVQWYPERCEFSSDFINGKWLRTLRERLKVGAQKVVYGPPGVIFVPFLHYFSGVVEGFEFWRLCWTDGGDKEIDARRVQSVGDGDVVETRCWKRKVDRGRLLLKYEVELRWIRGVKWAQVVGITTLGKLC
jgi:hypothetical protein